MMNGHHVLLLISTFVASAGFVLYGVSERDAARRGYDRYSEDGRYASVHWVTITKRPPEHPALLGPRWDGRRCLLWESR